MAKLVRYRKPGQINVGMIIFLIIFLYIVFSVYSYLHHQQIHYYEVLEGGIFRDESFTGVAIREEKAYGSAGNGHLHYYIQEGRRVAVGANVYTIDETGALEDYFAQHPELTNELSEDQLSEIRSRLSSFSKSFRNQSFDSLYESKYALESTTMEFASIASVQDLDSVLDEIGNNYIRVPAEEAGVVSYTLDGEEGITAMDVDQDLLSMTGYQKQVTKPGAEVDTGDLVYKLVTESTWSIVFPMTEEEKAKYQDRKTVKIYLADRDQSLEAGLQIFTANDGNSYGELQLDSLMEEYIGERFVSFEMVNNERKGLKIPLTSITEKEFYIVPKDFLVSNSDGSSGFYRQVLKDGQVDTEFKDTEIYRIDDQYCYLNVPGETVPKGDGDKNGPISLGDVLVRQGNGRTYSVGPTKSIQGVYNMNKGYCVFRQIVPIESNNEYVIVEKNTDYGISIYDHIVLDASMVQEGQLIYQ